MSGSTRLSNNRFMVLRSINLPMTRRLVTLGLALCAALSQAAPITYEVTRNIGTSTLTGSVTTDGTVGQLRYQDILSFALTIGTASHGDYVLDSAGGASVGSNSVVGSIDLFATPTTLTFDPSLPETGDGVLEFVTSGASGTIEYQARGQPQSIEEVIVSTPLVFDFQSDSIAGSLVFASARSVAAGIDEPSTLALLALAVFGAIAAVGRGRRTGEGAC